MYKTNKSFFVFLFGILLISPSLSGEELDQIEQMDPLELLFREKGKDYPGCVFIVRDEAQYIDEEKVNEIVPHLLDACIKGRKIGEKRMQKMYEIDPKKDKPKNKSFNIRLAPLHEINDEKNILYKE